MPVLVICYVSFFALALEKPLWWGGSIRPCMTWVQIFFAHFRARIELYNMWKLDQNQRQFLSYLRGMQTKKIARSRYHTVRRAKSNDFEGD